MILWWFFTSFFGPPKKWDSKSNNPLVKLGGPTYQLSEKFPETPGIVVAGDATILVDGTRSRDGFPHLETLHLGGQGDFMGPFATRHGINQLS